MIHGLLTMLHINLNHPTAYQLTKAFTRNFYAIDSDKYIKQVTSVCPQCESIKEIPKAMIKESTDLPPDVIGGRFAADVIKRFSQKILCIRETITSYTLADLIPDERKETIAESIVKHCNILRPSPATPISIRVDSAPANQTLAISLQNVHSQSLLRKNNIKLILPQAVANLNTCYRSSGLSAQELCTKRDQTTGEPLPIDDMEVIIQQYQTRCKNHKTSEKCKSQGKPPNPTAEVEVGSLVFVYADRNKLHARKRYIVSAVNGDKVKLRRFTEQLLGGKEYDSNQQEIYKVPSIVETVLPDNDDEDSSDEHYMNTAPISDTATHMTEDTTEENSQSEDSDNDSDSVTHPHPSDSESDEEEVYDDKDPTFIAPRNVTPAKMTRQRRATKSVDCYGDWVST